MKTKVSRIRTIRKLGIVFYRDERKYHFFVSAASRRRLGRVLNARGCVTTFHRGLGINIYPT